MTTRRDFLRAGGLGLAGLAVAAPLGGWGWAPSPARGANPAAPVVVRMRSDALGARVWFDPAGLRVTPGTIVRWVVEANVHSTTAYHPGNANFALRLPTNAEPWDSGILTQPGQTYEHRFRIPGLYDYYCTPHELAGMVGRILVLPEDDPGRDLREPDPAADGRRPPSKAARSAFPPIDLVLRQGIVRIPTPGQEATR